MANFSINGGGSGSSGSDESSLKCALASILPPDDKNVIRDATLELLPSSMVCRAPVNMVSGLDMTSYQTSIAFAIPPEDYRYVEYTDSTCSEEKASQVSHFNSSPCIGHKTQPSVDDSAIYYLSVHVVFPSQG
eukprot:scaffold4506_cov176-Ochromonas_danica.AAC.2